MARPSLPATRKPCGALIPPPARPPGGCQQIAWPRRRCGVAPDGRTLVLEERPHSANGWKERILLVDAATGSIRQALDFARRGFEFTGYHHEGRFSFLPGEKLLTSHDDGTLRIWDLAAGQELPRLNDRRALVTLHDLSPDGHWVAAGTEDGSIRIWEVDTGQEVHRLSGHAGPVRTCTSARTAASCCRGASIPWPICGACNRSRYPAT